MYVALPTYRTHWHRIGIYTSWAVKIEIHCYEYRQRRQESEKGVIDVMSFNDQLIHCPVLIATVREVATNDDGDLLSSEESVGGNEEHNY